MNLGNDFKDYAINKMGISPMEFLQWEQIQDRLYGANASLTPYILEEREMRVTQMDIFSRMMMDRIIWLAGPVNDRMSTVVQAQLMFLDNIETKDITLHIDSPGGSVKSGLSIVDVMDYVSSDIVTINTGMAASMGSILLGAGTKGKRYSLRFSKVMLHQVSSSAQGHVRDMEISLIEAKKYNDILFTMLGDFCGKTKEEIINDCNRDNWLDSQQALDYGIIDSIIKTKKK